MSIIPTTAESTASRNIERWIWFDGDPPKGQPGSQRNTATPMRPIPANVRNRGPVWEPSPKFDHKWKFAGAMEKWMHANKMYDRETPYAELKEGSGADFMPQYKKYILDGKTIVPSPHKVYGPQQNDLVLQLQKREVSQIILLAA